MSNKINLKGKRILVTGAGQGIGRSICTYLTECNASVIGLSKTQKYLNSLGDVIGCETLCYDLADTKNLAKSLSKHFPVDGCVNNAGITHLAPFISHNVKDFEKVLAINLRAAMEVSQLCAASMIAQEKGGSIVNISSVASSLGVPGHTAYCTSKAALEAMTRVMAVELGSANIRTNCICPTVTMTSMGKKVWSDPKMQEKILDRIQMGRFVEPIEIAYLTAFLLSDLATMITGQAISIDGGYSVS